MTLEELFGIIESRAETDPTTSWTAKFLAKGPEKCAGKFGEEAVEAIKDDKIKLVSEAADVLFHLLVMLKSRDVMLADVMEELEKRQDRSGLQEKKSREVRHR